MSKINIMELCEHIDAQNLRHKKRFSNVKSNWLVFDKDDNPYLITATRIQKNIEKNRRSSGLPSEKYYEACEIKAFELKVHRITDSDRSCHIDFEKTVAHAEVTTEESVGRKDLVLHRIHIDDLSLARKGLGTALLQCINLFASKRKCKNIVGRLNGYDFMYGKYKKVKEFYSKNEYEVSDDGDIYVDAYVDVDEEGEEYNDSAGSFEMPLNPKKLHKTKLKSVNYPMYNMDITVLVPETKTKVSGYKKTDGAGRFM